MADIWTVPGVLPEVAGQGRKFKKKRGPKAPLKGLSAGSDRPYGQVGTAASRNGRDACEPGTRKIGAVVPLPFPEVTT